jgi:phage terminase large subunit-like protein
MATWITEALLEEQRSLLPEPAYRRLWLNEWTSGAGDAISESDLAEAFARGLGPMRGGEEGFEFCAGLDLSVSRDRSALVAVGKDESGRYRVARCKVWQPPKGGKIDQSQIEQTILDWNERFRFRSVLADPYQAEYIIERLRRQGVAMQGRPQTGRGLCEQASALLECFSGENIDVLNDARLEHDLRAARVVEKSYGWRIESPRDTHGHGDSLTALQLAVVAARAIVAMRIKLDVWQDDELNRAKQESLRERLLLGMPADAGSPKTHNAFLERFMQ